ncbi:hypothetical protein [Ekhidna sp.]|uniref:hypothetical protein n=1 Tax=Ekhidna sp. TaxID=2608089 RepID=UPI0032996B7F
MDIQKRQQLNKVENVLYIIIVSAIVTDILSGQTHALIFLFSTIILVTGILGIISIELIKLQWKLKQRN